ncbi:MAG: hypothetical protein ACRDSZ_07840 [Pseudonocardiaceae bacterium]
MPHIHHEDGVRVHEQEPVRWEEREVRFESRLLFPDGEHPPATYLQLSIENLRLTWRFVDVFLPIAAARRLRDQLTTHLDAVAGGLDVARHSPARAICGVDGGLDDEPPRHRCVVPASPWRPA